MDRVVFACRHNAGRSQMAAAFLNRDADPTHAHAISAGTTPSDQVHPEVAAVMSEVGIDLSAAKPQLLSTELAAGAKLLVAMGCGEECPYVPRVEFSFVPMMPPPSFGMTLSFLMPKGATPTGSEGPKGKRKRPGDPLPSPSGED